MRKSSLDLRRATVARRRVGCSQGGTPTKKECTDEPQSHQSARQPESGWHPPPPGTLAECASAAGVSVSRAVPSVRGRGALLPGASPGMASVIAGSRLTGGHRVPPWRRCVARWRSSENERVTHTDGHPEMPALTRDSRSRGKVTPADRPGSASITHAEPRQMFKVRARRRPLQLRSRDRQRGRANQANHHRPGILSAWRHL
jgi:hypothetical protein